MGFPTIYPTGVTLYDQEKAYNGYTVFPSAKGALLIDMNGNEVRHWAGLTGGPNKILPGGYLFGSTGIRNPKYGAFDSRDLVQVDWDGKIVWKFDHNEYVSDPGEKPRYIARQNHDFQREGSSTGYYAPGEKPGVTRGNTLILVGQDVKNPDVSGVPLLDSRLIEVTWDGEIVWEWRANEHFEEMGFDEAAKNVIYRLPATDLASGGDKPASAGRVPLAGLDLALRKGYWLAINNFNTLGPNRWYDAGDDRFHPDNIIWTSRNANILAIISKKTGKIVWRLGPDFNASPAARALGWIIGPHHLHMIPRGLPGEGNLLVLDNGGYAGYGLPNGTSEFGTANERRDYSRVLEFNPVTLEITWQYTPAEAGFIMPLDAYKFYTPFTGAVQRLPNGNTLITEGRDGRLIEVTPEHQTVWEYVSPYFQAGKTGITAIGGNSHSYVNNWVYRAYRVPYHWIPQLEKPRETSIAPPNVTDFRVPGSPNGAGKGKITVVQGVDPTRLKAVRDPYEKVLDTKNRERDFCVLPSDDAPNT